MINKDKRFMALFLVLCLLVTTILPTRTYGESVYLGGSGSVGSGGTGGSHSIVLPSGFPMALRVSIQVQNPGEFAKEGYEKKYPTAEYSLVLVPNGTPSIAKTRNVLASKGSGVCDYVTNHKAVIMEGDGGAKEAIWRLFMKGVSTYNGDATSLIGSGRTADYGDLVPTELFISAGLTPNYILQAGRNLYVSTEDVDKEDTVKQTQVTLTGIALGSALKEQGQDLDLKDMANYFTGERSKNEYIVVIENMLACKDTANDKLGYWWTLSNTAISQISGHDVISEEYSGTTGEYLQNVCVNKASYDPRGINKKGYVTYDRNISKQYLFNYWFAPTNNKGEWALDIAVSTLWYSRGKMKMTSQFGKLSTQIPTLMI